MPGAPFSSPKTKSMQGSCEPRVLCSLYTRSSLAGEHHCDYVEDKCVFLLLILVTESLTRASASSWTDRRGSSSRSTMDAKTDQFCCDIYISLEGHS
uniref:Uncharacterized protein n=1 Tax=Aegilops tauschii subsp. strangulata TaxID=200361 RepID=A0A453JJI9_AEGTS